MSTRKRVKEQEDRPKQAVSWTLWLHFLWVFLALVIVLSVDHWPSKVSLVAGQVSSTSIKAERTVEVINEQATEEARRRAAAQVDPAYVFDPTAVRMGEQKLEETFQVLSKLAALKRQGKNEEDPEMKDALASLPLPLTRSTLDLFLDADADLLMQAETDAKHVLWQVMEGGITQENLETVRATVPEKAQEMLAALPTQYVPAVAEATAAALGPNRHPDFEATRRAEQEAMAAVKPVTTVIPEGYAVVREGDLVTPKQIQALEALGVYKPRLDVPRIVGYALLVFCLMAVILAYLRREQKGIYASRKRLVLLGVIMVATGVICRMLVGLSEYLAPVAIASILVTVLLESRLGLLVTGFLAIYVGVMASSLPACVVSFLTGAAGCLALSRVCQRSHLIYASVMVGLTNLVGVVALELIDSSNFQSGLIDIGFGGLNGLLSAWLAVGALPMFEHFSGITTHLRLLDISNPSEALLQRLLKEAPGTYQHSIMVANLAESAAQAIGADALLCRVGSYYHDIGKMKRPRFFVENQMGAENPHDRLAPSLSTLIILSHVKDGVEMGRQARLPDVILDFIAEHHGTSLVSYFYHQACSRSSEPVYEDDFRYPGPKPQSKETAIVMLCDGLEAAARTLSNPTPEKISELVHKMIKHQLDDGQLDECDLSLKDIDRIRESLVRSLQNVYHARIEYPEPVSLSGSRKKVTHLRRKV